ARHAARSVRTVQQRGCDPDSASSALPPSDAGGWRSLPARIVARLPNALDVQLRHMFPGFVEHLGERAARDFERAGLKPLGNFIPMQAGFSANIEVFTQVLREIASCHPRFSETPRDTATAQQPDIDEPMSP